MSEMSDEHVKEWVKGCGVLAGYATGALSPAFFLVVCSSCGWWR